MLAAVLGLIACGGGGPDFVDAGGDAAIADGGSGDGGDGGEPLRDCGLVGDADEPDGAGGAGDGGTLDAAVADGAVADAAVTPDAALADAAVADAAVADAAVPPDAALPDATVTLDAALPDATVTLDAAALDAAAGVIGGGPCLSGAPGATAFRIRWAGSGSTAYVQYEVNGLPDTSRSRAGAYGYQIGYTPAYVDTFLGDGGLRLDGSSFVDLELSTIGVSQIAAARLSIYGRSYHTTASGSFNWQTFVGSGAAPTNLVSNVAPYAWYTAIMTPALAPGDGNVLVRIKAGPSSGSLVVHRIELCLQAS